jgi:hypothetical protein
LVVRNSDAVSRRAGTSARADVEDRQDYTAIGVRSDSWALRISETS